MRYEPIRGVSCNELLYLDMQDVTNSFAIQYVFKIDKIYDLDKIQESINTVAKNNMGSDIFFKHGKWYNRNSKIIVKKLKVNTKDFFNSEFFREKINYKKESIKVYIVEHIVDTYLVFKFHHSTCDGKGAIIFISNFIRCLNKQKLLVCNNSVSDNKFVKRLNYNCKKIDLSPSVSINASMKVKTFVPTWKIITVDGYHSAIVSKILCILSKEFINESTRFMIPVDILRHDKNNNYIVNLTLPIFLNVSKNDNFQK